MYQSFDINILILYTTLTEELHIIPWSESYTSLLVLTTTTGEQIPRYNMDVWRGGEEWWAVSPVVCKE